MNSMSKKEYKIGEVYKTSAFLAAGLNCIRIEKTVSKNNHCRILFVFDRKDVDLIEPKYLSRSLLVDAMTLIGTISEVRLIIRNAANNVEKPNNVGPVVFKKE